MLRVFTSVMLVLSAPVASHDVQKRTDSRDRMRGGRLVAGAVRQDAELARGRREFAEQSETASN